jgi:hypothetical protein
VLGQVGRAFWKRWALLHSERSEGKKRGYVLDGKITREVFCNPKMGHQKISHLWNIRACFSSEEVPLTNTAVQENT